MKGKYMMRGLRLFSRTNKPSCINLASYHDPRSLTWSWLLSWTFATADERRALLRFNRFEYGQHKWSLSLLWLGRFSWASQGKMLRRAA